MHQNPIPMEVERRTARRAQLVLCPSSDSASSPGAKQQQQPQQLQLKTPMKAPHPSELAPPERRLLRPLRLPHLVPRTSKRTVLSCAVLSAGRNCCVCVDRTCSSCSGRVSVLIVPFLPLTKRSCTFCSIHPFVPLPVPPLFSSARSLFAIIQPSFSRTAKLVLAGSAVVRPVSSPEFRLSSENWTYICDES